MDKARERRLVETFIAAQGLSGCVVQDHEEPDFLVEIAGRCVGIEVTDLVEAKPRQAAPPQQWSAEGRRLIRRTRESFESGNRQAVVVHLAFKPETPAREFRDRTLPPVLASVVENHLGQQASGAWTLGPFKRDPHPRLAWLYAAVLSGGDSDWQLGSLSHVHPATCDDVATTVAGKEPLVAKYRVACREIWLLINCDLVGQEVTLTTPGLPCRVSTSFDGVFCIDFYGTCREATCAEAG